MTHHTDAERAAFEEFASVNGERPELVARNQAGEYQRLDTATGWMWWQAARRAPAAPVPQGWKDVAELCAQMCDSRASSLVKDQQLTAANEARKCAIVLRNPPDYWREKLQAAAPQPPEAQASVSNGTLDTPVRLPEPVGCTTKQWGVAWNTSQIEAGTKLYTEQQVRELLEANGICVAK